ncbi:hypothetical protein PHYSODRAFT_512708 [Phytophthora sojae]|uniref:Uncharacterized protein n=1 Tax=Phytophthora sojae (strain P6497) TaxID=1094619 RepID=G4ZUS9_PHYSP|nr:hypothetical protein PHYSODRAFT_512708 [Phytophthora sojae]EGZ13553.1 hypothetical protein PHYSODRAFT_512708 [Phytophthora sojae]|eukprot:XP_009530982.1 hypothetical protein PHYSODRAFT_512708 [Phytophthora sojae]
MAPSAFAMSPIRAKSPIDPLTIGATRRRRKETVNERVEHILRGALRDAEEEALQEREGDPETRGRALQRSHQLASLYTTSTENKFLRARAKDAALTRHRIEAEDSEDCEIQSKTRPWYGCSPAATLKEQIPLGITLDAKLRRYGARGTAKLQHGWRSQEALEPLSPNHPIVPVDEFVSGLSGSPSLWPPEAFHPTGSRLPVRMTRCPSSPIAVSLQQKSTQKLQTLYKQEKRIALETQAQNQRDITEWQSRTLHFQPSSELAAHRKQQESDPQLRHRRTQVSAIVQTPGYSPEKQRSQESNELKKKRFPLRWRSFAKLLDAMRRTPCRRPVLQDMEKLFALARELGALNALGTCMLSRAQFTLLVTREFPSCDLKYVNRLFSSYDWELRDSVDARVVLGAIRAMRVQQGEPVELICATLRDFDGTTDMNGKSVAGDKAVVSDGGSLTKALSLCCFSDSEEKDMENRAEMIWTKSLSWQRQILSRRLHGGAAYNIWKTRGAWKDEEDVMEEIPELTRLVDESRVPVRRIRAALKRERETLALFTQQLLQRRHECMIAANTRSPRT